MNSVDLVRIIGISHLLQPPLTLFLAGASGINLRAALVPKTPLAAQVLFNMAVAAVCLPTALGVFVAVYAGEALQPGPARAVAALVAVFWCWRLYRQVCRLSPIWPRAARGARFLNSLLTAIFVAQGPGLGLLILSRCLRTS